jgi:hypothetical protein
VAPDDAPVCTLLAWTAYARGEGALANVALDRALAGRPDYSLALLLRAALDGGVHPDEVRSLARGTEQVLRSRPGRRRARHPTSVACQAAASPVTASRGQAVASS